MTAALEAVVAFVAWLATFFGKRIALGLTFVTLISTFYATMVIVVSSATAVWVYATPEWVTNTAAIFLPSQTGNAMAAVMTARIARWVYDTSIKVAVVLTLIG